MKILTGYKIATSSCAALLILATSCQSVPATDSSTSDNNSSSIPSQPSATASQQTLSQQALDIQRALATKRYADLIDDIHPTRGVRFSMYAYIRPESDKVFSRAQFAQYLQQSKIRFTWGDLDGAGELFIMPLPTYLDTWVNGSKFNDARITVNKFESRGNMINNIKDIYPYSDIVDFYHKGSEQYNGMDWRGMRLVFDDYQGKRYLVAIVNDQWTV